jgi:AcrR family transcriptional regulator
MKEKIINASLQLFLKNGIRKMTILKLVKEMDISTKTVYKYFADKEDLLEQCLLVHYKLLSNNLLMLEESSSNPVISVYRMWEGALELDFGVNHIFYRDLNYYYPKMQDSVLNKTVRKNPDSIMKFIDDAIRKGYFRKDANPQVVLAVMETLYTSICRTETFKHIKIKPEILLQNTMEPYLRGLCTTKGLKAFEKKQ